jgi:transposase
MECAQLCGVPFAANAYNVGQSTIYKWIAASNTNTKTTGNTANN